MWGMTLDAISGATSRKNRNKNFMNTFLARSCYSESLKS